MAIERQTAIALSVSEVLTGRYVVKEGWTPNYIETSRGHASRTSIIGAIIQEVEPGVWILDDGSGQLQLRSFEGEKPKIAIGDVVNAIGRPRDYNKTRYLNYEIIKKVANGWLEYRKKELELLGGVVQVHIEETGATQEEVDQGEEVIVETDGTLFETILETIRKQDEANGSGGADIDAVLAKIKSPQAQHVLKSLMEEGEVFEIKPGKIKVLE